MSPIRAVFVAALLAGVVGSSCGIVQSGRPTPAGDWRVVTDPSAIVGRPVKVIFRFREGEAPPSEESFAFTAMCTTCSEPKPLVAGTATKQSGSGGEQLYSGMVTFPSSGTWWTSPYVGPIEVR